MCLRHGQAGSRGSADPLEAYGVEYLIGIVDEQVRSALPSHTHSTLARLLDADRLPLCHRSVLGRIFESKNMSHTDVDSAVRACDLRRGRGRAREAVAHGRGRSVLLPCFVCPRPARKPPVHGLCCRTFVSCRVPFGGIYIYSVYKCVCP